MSENYILIIYRTIRKVIVVFHLFSVNFKKSPLIFIKFHLVIKDDLRKALCRSGCSKMNVIITYHTSQAEVRYYFNSEHLCVF